MRTLRNRKMSETRPRMNSIGLYLTLAAKLFWTACDQAGATLNVRSYRGWVYCCNCWIRKRNPDGMWSAVLNGRIAPKPNAQRYSDQYSAGKVCIRTRNP